MAPVRIGIVGSGAIAQVHHLPNLMALREEFSVEVLCDLSPALVQSIAERFHVPRYVTDYRELLAADIDAVLICCVDPKTEVARAAFDAGLHVFIEKPFCYTLDDADAIIEAANAAGRVGQLGYMKVFDPAFELVEQQVQSMEDIRYIQVNHLHTNNSHHLRHFDLERATDLPETHAKSTQLLRQAGLRANFGDLPAEAERAFYIVAGSLVHDLYGLRHLFGPPASVLSTEIWRDGYGITTVLEYAMGARCVATWIELPDILEFKETLEINSANRRVSLSYPTGFARGLLSEVRIDGVDDDGRAFSKELAVEWESPFSRELQHFHQCITAGTPCRTSIESGRHEVSLTIDIINRYLERG